MLKVLKIFAATLVLSYTLTAQESETIRVNFRVMPILSGEWTGIFYQPVVNGEMKELEFQSLSRSFETYPYTGENPIIFYRKGGIDENGKTIYAPVGRVLAKSKEQLLFFVTNKAIGRNDAIEEFSLIGLDDSPQGLPMDYISFLNLTGVELGCRFRNENILMRAGFNGPYSLRDSLGKDLFVGMVVQHENSQRIVMKNNWHFESGNRHIILLLPPKKAGSFRIRAYRITEYVGENSKFNSAWTLGEAKP
ncbi:MAG: hypothetical protein ISR41_08300 [Puniceicoccaceae bacterium]|nr:hypothetical protein [Puniceicoccaceae bacterium]